jgi:3-oxoacyl-[acyl-carrier-protein] synthase II
VGNDVASYWAALMNGEHGFANIIKFDAKDFKVKIAAEVKNFDPQKYIERSEIRKTDMYAQYAIAAAAQAMDDSGIAGTVKPERLGVYIGSGIGGMNTFISETEKLLHRGPHKVSPYFIPMMIANIGAALVCMRYNAKGPCLPIVSACATSTHSIGEAYRAIKYGHADAVIAGGAEACVNPLAVAGFTNCLALSTKNDPELSSIPFDARRDGFVIGEGAGVLVLEEYERAASRGAHIYAEALGYGNTCDAYHVTAPHPAAEGAIQMIRLALEEAGLPPTGERLYINPHGTSTSLNDKTETLAIKSVFGENAFNIPISSTKSMIGHTLGAAGALEALASIKTLQTGIAHQTRGWSQRDPECDLDYVPNASRRVEVDFALSMSLGFGGHNAGIVLARPGYALPRQSP